MAENNVKYSIITYNTIMDFYASAWNADKVLAIFDLMRLKGITEDDYTYSIIMKAFKTTKNLKVEMVDKIFLEYRSYKFNSDNIVYNNLIDIYIHLKEYKRAKDIYVNIIEEGIVIPDQITFNTLIKGACKGRDL